MNQVNDSMLLYVIKKFHFLIYYINILIFIAIQMFLEAQGEVDADANLRNNPISSSMLMPLMSMLSMWNS